MGGMDTGRGAPLPATPTCGKVRDCYAAPAHRHRRRRNVRAHRRRLQFAAHAHCRPRRNVYSVRCAIAPGRAPTHPRARRNRGHCAPSRRRHPLVAPANLDAHSRADAHAYPNANSNTDAHAYPNAIAAVPMDGVRTRNVARRRADTSGFLRGRKRRRPVRLGASQPPRRLGCRCPHLRNDRRSCGRRRSAQRRWIQGERSMRSVDSSTSPYSNADADGHAHPDTTPVAVSHHA